MPFYLSSLTINIRFKKCNMLDEILTVRKILLTYEDSIINLFCEKLRSHLYKNLTNKILRVFKKIGIESL